MQSQFHFNLPLYSHERSLLNASYKRLLQWVAVNGAMYKNSSGKLLVYASTGFPSSNRLESVKTAAQQTAKRLNMDFGVKIEKPGVPIYVYYESDSEEPIPLYCDEGKKSDLEEISSALRNMMFVLSFHPRQTALRQMRNEIVKLS